MIVHLTSRRLKLNFDIHKKEESELSFDFFF